MTKFCQYCGSNVEPGERFCSLCGHEIEKPKLKDTVKRAEIDERDRTIDELKNRIRHLEQQVSSSNNEELIRLRQELDELKRSQSKPVFAPQAQVQPPTRRSSSSGCGWCCCCIFIIFIIGFIFIIFS